ncbi:hypothetical protein K501DRAFT_189207 [Backusella circina FSU 941]|nr:hypothetical protein K501DRAFT_189207 [Backusella circina FSU 941]
MMPDNISLVETQKVLDAEVEKRIDELKQSAYWEWQSVGEGSNSASFNCVFQMFGQLHPVPSNIKMSELLEYEKELENSQGLSTIDPPPLLLSSELYSPNCQLLLSSLKEPGIKIEIYYNKAISYAGLATIIAVIQIFSLIYQMEFTPTPSSVSNVSYWTIAIQAAMDGYLCLLHLTTGVVIDNVFLPFATAAFFTFILVSIFGMRYLLVVWRIQRPESIRAQSQPVSPAPEPAEESNEGTTGDTLLPLANRPAVNRPAQEESNPQRDSVTRSAFVQNIIIGTLGFAFYSYWIPQIVRNVLRGCRHPLSHRYILIMSITRLSVPLYFYGCPENLIGHETTKWVWALVGYVAIQVAILFLQDQFGPRFFVPSRYLPQTYNYHPVLQDDDENEEEEQHQHKRRDCAICFLPVDSTNSSYMVTPCDHIFHTDCLQKVSYTYRESVVYGKEGNQ